MMDGEEVESARGMHSALLKAWVYEILDADG